MFNIPNLLTIFRILLVPLFVLSVFSPMDNNILIMIIILLLAGISDLLDGYIARKFNLCTKLGAVLDPIADKLMQGAVLLCLLKLSKMPLWVILFICIKELILCIGAIVMLKKGADVKSDYSGKTATFTFYLSSFVLILFDTIPILKNILILIVIVSALYALVDYSIIFFKNTNLKRNEQND